MNTSTKLTNMEKELFNLPVITSIRPEIGITKEMQGEYVLIEYPQLGFSELVHPQLTKINFVVTTIESNGSKWAGEEPATINELIEVLKIEKIESRFFEKIYYAHHNKWIIMCPIKKEKNGQYHFFGNFEALSHVFNIRSNDPGIIRQLITAITNNPGWKAYIKNLKNKTIRTQFCSYMS